MNANEVIANLCYKTSKVKIHPNDDVNMSQSSNDVIPTVMNLAYYFDSTKKLMPALDLLIETLEKKAFFSNVSISKSSAGINFFVESK